MSMLRKTVLATAIIGVGLGSMSGAAFAWDHHGDAKGCSNDILGGSENGAGTTLGNTTGGSQSFNASNTCDIFNGNTIGSKNNTADGGSTIRNGDSTDITKTSNTTSDRTSSSMLSTLGL